MGIGPEDPTNNTGHVVMESDWEEWWAPKKGDRGAGTGRRQFEEPTERPVRPFPSEGEDDDGLVRVPVRRNEPSKPLRKARELPIED